MRIRSFWAKGYRSLKDVRVDDLGAFNVLYGPNGSGKSNLLAAMRTLFELLALGPPPPGEGQCSAGLVLQHLSRDDLCQRDSRRRVVLGAQVEATPSRERQALAWELLEVELLVDWIVENDPVLRCATLRLDGEPWRRWVLQTTAPDEEGERQAAAFLVGLARRCFGLVGADRSARSEQQVAVKQQGDAVAEHLREGRLKNALFTASVHPDPAIRQGLRDLRKLLGGEPLRRPPFDLVQDPANQTIEVREQLPDANGRTRDVPLDLAGLGIVQIYHVLAGAMLLGTRVVGVEEPEAHLHAPTTGRQLRELLVRLVREGYLDQLFIATHSNLFDLDLDGYYDVSLDADGCTRVERAELTRVDRDHLYEPGPAKHALQALLRYAPPDETVFRLPDGGALSAAEMLRRLQEDDEAAVSFLRDLHGAALRVVRLSSKRPSP